MGLQCVCQAIKQETKHLNIYEHMNTYAKGTEREKKILPPQVFFSTILPQFVILPSSLTALSWLSSPQSVPSEPRDALKRRPAVTSRRPSIFFSHPPHARSYKNCKHARMHVSIHTYKNPKKIDHTYKTMHLLLYSSCS